MVLNTDTTCALSAISIRTLFVLNGMFPLVFIGPFVWHLRETEFSRAGNIPVVQHLLTQVRATTAACFCRGGEVGRKLVRAYAVLVCFFGRLLFYLSTVPFSFCGGKGVIFPVRDVASPEAAPCVFRFPMVVGFGCIGLGCLFEPGLLSGYTAHKSWSYYGMHLRRRPAYAYLSETWSFPPARSRDSRRSSIGWCSVIGHIVPFLFFGWCFHEGHFSRRRPSIDCCSAIRP